MRRAIAILLLITGAITTYSQEKKNEWMVWGEYGTSSLLYSVYGGSLTLGTGNGIGAGCIIPMTSQWRILVGIELQNYTSSVYFNQLIDSHQSVANSIISTDENSSSKNNFLYTAIYDNFREQQEVTYLHIPIMARFAIGERPLYSMVGVKLGIPVSATFNTTASTLTTTGYFEYDYLTLTDQPEYGFVEESNYKASGNLALNWQVALSGEFGYKMGITTKCALYLALYIDYSLTDAYKEAAAQNELLAYNAENPTYPTQYSLLTTQQNHISLSGYTYNRIKTLSGGIKIAFGFTTPQPKQQPQREPKKKFNIK